MARETRKAITDALLDLALENPSRTNFSMTEIAERAGVSRQSVWAVEKGSPSVVMGTYLKVLHAVGFDKDLLKVCADDPLGKFLQDQRDDKYKREEEVEDRW